MTFLLQTRQLHLHRVPGNSLENHISRISLKIAAATGTVPLEARDWRALATTVSYCRRSTILPRSTGRGWYPPTTWLTQCSLPVAYRLHQDKLVVQQAQLNTPPSQVGNARLNAYNVPLGIVVTMAKYTYCSIVTAAPAVCCIVACAQGSEGFKDVWGYRIIFDRWGASCSITWCTSSASIRRIDIAIRSPSTSYVDRDYRFFCRRYRLYAICSRKLDRLLLCQHQYILYDQWCWLYYRYLQMEIFWCCCTTLNSFSA